MESLENIISRLKAAIPGAQVNVVSNGAPSAQHSFMVDNDHAVEVATFLRDDPQLRFDMATSVTGVDWLDSVEKRTAKVARVYDGVEKVVEETTEVPRPGYLEAIYHLYSVELRHGPLILRLRTRSRTDTVIPSLTPVWRGAEFQEREIYDLYGIEFSGHPDLRRILMWEEFKDYPMRKDYVEPDDYEYEPTPHEDVLVKARHHFGEAGK